MEGHIAINRRTLNALKLMEKSKELYKLSKEVFKEEQERFKRLDEKASKYFTVLAVLLGIYGFFGKWIIENLQAPFSDIEKLLILTNFILLILIFGSLYCVFSVLKTKGLKKMHMNIEMVEFFEKHELKDIFQALAEKYGEVLSENRRKTEDKADLLDYAHKLMICTGYLLLIHTLLFALVNIFNKIYHQ